MTLSIPFRRITLNKGVGVVIPPAPALDPSVTGLTLLNTIKTRAALARVRRNTGSMKILTVGDSTTASGGVASGNSRYNAWPGIMADKLRDEGLLAVNKENFLAYSGVTSNSLYMAYFPNITLTGAWTAAGGYTIGGVAFSISSAGNMTFVTSGSVDKFRLLYVKGPTAGVFSWKIDGGAATQVTRTAASSELAELIIDSGNAANLATPGVHTVTITWVSGYISIVGIEAMNAASPNRIRVLNGGRSSSTVGDWIVSGAPHNPLPMITSEAADLVFINLGINNWRAADVTAQFSTDYQKIIDAAQDGGSDVILMQSMPSTSSGGSENVSEARQTGYRDAISALALSNGLPVISLRDFYGSGNQALADGWLLSDGIHQTVEGYARTGTLVADTLRYIERMVA